MRIKILLVLTSSPGFLSFNREPGDYVALTIANLSTVRQYSYFLTKTASRLGRETTPPSL